VAISFSNDEIASPPTEARNDRVLTTARGTIIKAKAAAGYMKEIFLCHMVSSWNNELYINIPFV
jgi:hypothetical protein